MISASDSHGAAIADRSAVAPDPGFAFTCSETRDADEAAQRLQAWDQVYQQLTPGMFAGVTTELWLESLQLFRERSNRRVYQAGRAWQGSVTFGIPLAMEGTARYCGQPLELDSMMVLGVSGELDFLTSPTLDIVGISVPRERLASLSPQPSRSDNRVVKMNPDLAARLRASLQTLFEAIEADPSSLASEGVRQQICDELLEPLAAADGGRDVQPRPAARHAHQRAIVRRATEYVLAHADEPIFVERLCEVVGMSRRSLQYAFEQVLGTSPVDYLRTMRLHGVRRELKSTPRSAASIQDVAARWGFWHLGHFITHYRKLFGCRPSETPRRA